MNEIRSHRDLVAWQKAVEFGLLVYEVTKSFPSDERFGLTSQMRRGTVSVASNIAEGYGRGSTSDYLRFLPVARGALFEVDTQLIFAVRLGLVSQEKFDEIESKCKECGRILAGLIRSIEEKRGAAE
ncbi:MAG: four helix bundle protein [Phycisphaerales bacterium]|nr:four helix bundle protein [Phycisphaerales bacterium]